MEINKEFIELKEAKVNDKYYRKKVWKIFNENIKYSQLTNEPISYKNHCLWWEKVFSYEFIYIILYKSEVCGYIRITKCQTQNKDKNEISIALLERYQNLGIGSYAYTQFEKQIKKKGINQVIANTLYKNKNARKFFESNDFKKIRIKYKKKI